MMQVDLIYFTGKDTPDPVWYAARLLAFTKNTRLNMTPDNFTMFMQKTPEELTAELNYMSNTIPSAWEFIDLIFCIQNISRACAQQITRTRNAVFQMQSQRVSDVRKSEAYIPPSIPLEHRTMYTLALSASLSSYGALLDRGISPEDARGVLPLSIHCNLIAKYNFRNWVDLIRARDSLRVQDEYHSVILAMREQVLAALPWVKVFVQPKQAKAIELIETVAKELPKEQRTLLAKASDLLK
jgi:flavin-dependent thymidylate synthase